MLATARKNRLLTISDNLPTFSDMKRNRKRSKRNKPEVVKVGNIVVRIYKRTKRVKTKAKDGTVTEREYTVFEVEDCRSGSRVLRSFSDHSEAIAEANKIGDGQSSAKALASEMTNKEAASYGRAIELLRPTGATLEAAADTYARAVKILGGDLIIEAAKFYTQHRADKIVSRTVAEVVTELLTHKAKKSPRYISDLGSRLNRFANDFAVNISTITGPDVQRWLDKLDVEPQTKKNFRTVLHTLFRFAEQRQYILKNSNPAADTEKIEAENGEVEIYNPAELGRLIEATQKHHKAYLPALVIGAFAGLRSSEIERLTWEDIRLARGVIVASAKKRGTPSRRLVPIQPSLAAWLSPYSNRKGKVWTGDHDSFYDAQEEIAAATAVSEDKKKGIAAQGPVKWKHNGLRHSFISYRLAIVEDDAKVALEAGNSKATVHEHYRELVEPGEAKAWFAIAPEQAANVVQLKSEVQRA
jgi:integrase